MARSATRDIALQMSASSNVLTFEQTSIAQWNHNYYNQPAAYGYYTNGSVSAAADSYYNLDTTVIAKTFSTTGTQSIGTYSTTFNDANSNCIRIMFDIKISSTNNLSEPVNDFMLKVDCGITEFVGYFPISVNEGEYAKREILYVSNFESNEIFQSVTLGLYPINEISTGDVTIKIKNVCISYVRQDEVVKRQFDRLNWVFKPNRPGDQILENDLIDPAVNPISRYYINTETITDQIKRPEYYPFSISPYNSEISYIMAEGDYTTSYHNVYAEYEVAMKTNQIYIKTQDVGTLFYGQYLTAKNSEFRVYIKKSGAWVSTPIYTELSSDISTPFIDNGAVILQYDGANWTAGFDRDTVPSPSTTDGTISSSDVEQIQGIRIQVKNDGTQLPRLVEISPRLSLNLTDFMISSQYESTLDGGDYPIPVGMGAVNTGQIVFENIPRTVGSNIYQIFDDNALSPLYNLIKSDIKFILYTKIINTKDSSKNAEIKNFTMFSDKWEINDLETVTVSLSDYARYLQNTPNFEFLLMSNYHPNKIGTLQQAIEYLLQCSGFSDYDVTSLNLVSDNVKSKGARIPIFFANSDKKVWETLTSMLVGYQISCFFDENGILQFKDIIRSQPRGTYYSNSASYFDITDTTIGTGLPNIISIKVDKKQDIGELIMNYNQLSESNSLFSVNGTTTDATAVNFNSTVTISRMFAKTNPWEITNEPSGLICANIVDTVWATSTAIKVGDWTTPQSTKTNAGRPRFITGYSGYGIIEGEIVSWDGLQYHFTPYLPTFSVYETIRSSDELNDAVARRIAYLTSPLTITAAGQTSDGRLLVTTSSPHSLQAGFAINIIIYGTDGGIKFSGKFIVSSVSNTTQFYINLAGKPYPTGFSIRDDSVAFREPSNITFNLTGRLMNVRRGLFGTNATTHYSTTRFDRWFFMGSKLNTATSFNALPLGNINMTPSHEPDNSYSFPISTTKGRTTYLGFLEKDSNGYLNYRFVITPKTDLDRVGVFFGASAANYTSGTPTASYAWLKTDNTGLFANGIYIEMFPQNHTGGYGVIVRDSPNQTSISNIKYHSTQKLLHDDYKPREQITVYKKDSNGKIMEDDQGKPIILKRYWKYYPPSQQLISVTIKKAQIGASKRWVPVLQIQINKKTVYFKTGLNAKAKPVPYIPLWSAFKRNGKAFGMFIRNDSIDSALTINDIQAAAPNQAMDREVTWAEAGNKAIYDLNDLITNDSGRVVNTDKGRHVNGFSNGVQPFSLRAEPIIRGIAIFDVKYNNDIPYFDLKPFGPQGVTGNQIFLENSIQKSMVIGTPFRGRVAYRNTTGEIAPLKGDGDSYVNAKILGRSINVDSGNKLSKTLSSGANAQKIEITVPWINNGGAAQNILSEIAQKANLMNYVYEIDMFGIAPLNVGDYVKLSHSIKNLDRKPCVVSKVSHNFSDGGISTNVSLRSVDF